MYLPSLFFPEFYCHEGGATALGYCRPKQRLFCGGKRGEVCVFDIRQHSLLQSISLHSSAINCIVVNDIDGYFVTGSADGDIKVRIVDRSEIIIHRASHMSRFGKECRGLCLHNLHIHNFLTVAKLIHVASV